MQITVNSKFEFEKMSIQFFGRYDVFNGCN